MLLWTAPGSTALSGWLVDDALGRVILTLVSILFLAIAHYAVGYLRDESARGGRAFASCLLGFLAAASLVTLSHHFALLWIGLETTTLSVAPLIYHRHDRRSLEAVWKYLVLSSVGIAFALLGVFLLATAQPSGANGGQPLVLDDLIAHARRSTRCGCAPRLCSCSSASARRWDWRRCIRGSRTRTARHQVSSAD